MDHDYRLVHPLTVRVAGSLISIMSQNRNQCLNEICQKLLIYHYVCQLKKPLWNSRVSNYIIPQTAKLQVFPITQLRKIIRNTVILLPICEKVTACSTRKSSNFLKLQTLKCCLLNSYLLASLSNQLPSSSDVSPFTSLKLSVFILFLDQISDTFSH